MKGGCLCGEIRYEVSGEADPQMQFTCHCRDCQQVTGTGHARSMGVMSDAITWTGEPKVYFINVCQNRVREIGHVAVLPRGLP